MTPAHRALARQFVSAIISSIAVIIMGTLAAWPSPVLPVIAETKKPMSLTTTEVSWMVSLVYLGNFISPLPAGWLMDKIGRKISLLTMTSLPLSTWILTYFANSAMLLYIARILAGMWFGVVNTILPLYLAEIAEPKIRGSLSTLIQMTANFGIVFVYGIGPLISYEMLALICGCLPILFLLTFPFLPESPYWLLLVGKPDKAAKSYMWLRGQNSVELISEELNYAQNSIMEEMAKKQDKLIKDLFKTRSNRRALIIVVCLAAFQRFSGTSVLTVFASTALPSQGVGRMPVYSCVLVLGLISIVGVLISTLIIDLAGRKPMLISSALSSCVAMLTAGTWFFLNEKTSIDVSNIYYIPFATFCLYALGYCIGLGPIVGLIQGEIFPSYIRGLASGIIAEVLALSSLIVNKIYHPIGDSVGFYLNYWIYAVDCALASIFTICFVIETKQKTLFQIQEELNK